MCSGYEGRERGGGSVGSRNAISYIKIHHQERLSSTMVEMRLK